MSTSQTSEPASFAFGPYWNGQVNVYADPQEVYHLLQHATGGQFRKLLLRSREEGPADLPEDDEATLSSKEDERNSILINIVYPALTQIMAAVHVAFGMMPFDKTTGKGAGIGDCEDVLDDYLWFLDEQKKSTSTSPGSALATPASPVAP